MKHVVIADDSATARMLIRRCLEIAGLADAEFVEVANGQEALVVMKQSRPDLLVTDLTMPDMDGVTLLRSMAASPRLNGIPTMVVSSQTNPQVDQELKQLGVKAVLPKPVNPAVVAEAFGQLEIMGDEDAE